MRLHEISKRYVRSNTEHHIHRAQCLANISASICYVYVFGVANIIIERVRCVC